MLTGSAARRCKSCEAESDIASGERLWPSGWTCRSCGSKVASRGGFVCLAPEFDDENEGFDLQSFDSLADVESGHFWFVTRNELIEWLVRRYAPQAGRVLEIGCGTGYVLTALRRALPQAQIAGSELHTKGLVHARQRYGDAFELIQMDARKCGLSGALDLVGAFDVLEHIPEDEIVLDEIFRMLRPGGKLIATVPQHPFMWSESDDMAHHQRRYKMGELAKKAERAGFRVVYRSSFVVLTFPLMVLSRLMSLVRRRKRSMSDVLEAEFRLSAAVNGALLKVCRMEHLLRKMRLPMPFGGSQVLVVERP